MLFAQRLQGLEKQHEIMVNALADAMASAQREWDVLDNRSRNDRERFAAQQAKIQVYTLQLTETRNQIAALEHTQQDATASMSDLIERASHQNFVPVIDDYGAFIGLITRKAIIKYCQDKLFNLE
jgi:CBS domain containing-hemolysin-like protein